MARFIGEIQGSRGAVTRLGTAGSGISGHLRGWDIGVNVFLGVTDMGEDVCHVTITGGSNGRSEGQFIGTYARRNGRVTKVG